MAVSGWPGRPLGGCRAARCLACSRGGAVRSVMGAFLLTQGMAGGSPAGTATLAVRRRYKVRRKAYWSAEKAPEGPLFDRGLGRVMRTRRNRYTSDRASAQGESASSRQPRLGVLPSGKVPHRACGGPALGRARQVAGSTRCQTPWCCRSGRLDDATPRKTPYALGHDGRGGSVCGRHRPKGWWRRLGATAGPEPPRDLSTGTDASRRRDGRGW